MNSLDVTGLISLHPHHANRIYQGLKPTEFRRRQVRATLPAWWAIYECRPVCAVTGVMRLDSITYGSATDLIAMEPDQDERVMVAKYLEGAICSSAIQIGAVELFPASVPLAQFGVLRAPQSYQKLNGTLVSGVAPADNPKLTAESVQRITVVTSGNPRAMAGGS